MSSEILGLKLFTVKETADMLDLSTKTVKRHLREGTLAGYQIDKVWYVPDPCLKAFLSVETDRKRVREEALRLKSVFDDFRKKGDISQGHYDQAIERLSDFL